MTQSTRTVWLLAVAICTCLTGCARWYNEPVATNDSAKSLLPAAKPNPDTVDIETVLVRFTEDQLKELEETWKSVDETAIDLEQRRLLDRNGVRVGLIRGELPATIRRQLLATSQEQKADISQSAGLNSDADNRMRFLRCRSGRRKEIVIRRDIARPVSIVTTVDNRLSGQSFDDHPTMLVAMTPFPSPDGSVFIEFVPEIQFGGTRPSYAASESGIRQEQKRPTRVWKDLKIRAHLEQGNVLVIAATQPPKSLGGSFFVTETVHGADEHLILLVRLAATQMDDLFGDEQVAQARGLMEQR